MIENKVNWVLTESFFEKFIDGEGKNCDERRDIEFIDNEANYRRRSGMHSNRCYECARSESVYTSVHHLETNDFHSPCQRMLSPFSTYTQTLPSIEFVLFLFLLLFKMLRLLGNWEQNSLRYTRLTYGMQYSIPKLLIDTKQNALWRLYTHTHHRQSVRVITLHWKQLTGFCFSDGSG